MADEYPGWVISQGSRLIAAGVVSGATTDDFISALFVSEDGFNWEEVLRLPPTPDMGFSDMAVSEHGFVVVGTANVGNPPDPALRRAVPMAWVSPDGYSWQQIALAPEGDLASVHADGSAADKVVATPDKFVVMDSRQISWEISSVWLGVPGS